MASTSRTTIAAAAGAAALVGGASFVTVTPTSSHLRASTASASVARGQAAQSSQTASLAVAGAAVAALTASGRKVLGNVKPQLVTMLAFENELGVQAPVGFWDPVGFTADGDVAAFKRRRSVELKHGRISMMATMGASDLIVLHFLVYFSDCNNSSTSKPGFLSPSAGLKFADIPNGLAAVSKVPVAGWAQIAAYFGFVEFSGGFDDYKTGTPGDYGFKVLTSSDPEEKTKKLSAELANGRLAMMAIIGMFFQVCKGIGMCCGWIDLWIEDVFKHF
eukprot:symbB.v1.2.037219.t1/scaffold5435.1/size40275/2